MTRKLGLLFAAAIAVLAAAGLPGLARACGFPALELLFINTLHPDLPIGPYERGNLGVIQPSYSIIYLFVAYRNLVGQPIQASEAEALWHGDGRITSSPTKKARQPAVEGPAISAVVRPSDVPSTEPPPPPPPPQSIDYLSMAQYREMSVRENGMTWYVQYLNCPEDAFEEADKTRQKLADQFGEQSPVVQDWKKAQEVVFANCSAPSGIPAALPASAPTIARADRAYQIAAAHFYAADYDDAASGFRAIAQDPSSPWNTLAPYLVARALVRKATMTDKTELDFAALAQAEKQVESVLADPRLAAHHHAAERLRGFIEFRLHPDMRLAELANRLMRGSSDPDLAQDVTDFKLLFYRSEGGFYQGPPEVRGEARTGFANARAQSDFLDWILTLQGPFRGAYGHALEKWEATHSLPWLVAAVTTAGPDSPQVAELLAAAAKLSPRSPAYDSVTFQSLRLLALQGKNDEVRDRLAHLDIHRMGSMAPGFSTPPSTVNLLLAFHFTLARNLDELLENAPRVPATITNEWASQQLPDDSAEPNVFDAAAPRFDDDSLVAINRFLPVAMLAEAARSPRLTAQLRRDIALAAWTRAVLLGNIAIAHSLAPQVEAIDPGLRASIQAYDSAATLDDRRFAVALTLLRFPGLGPFVTQMERGNPLDKISRSGESWWDLGGPPCVYPQVYPDANSQVPKGPDPLSVWPTVNESLWVFYSNKKVKAPAFLTAEERAAAEQESRRLVEVGRAPDYLSKEAIAWAKTHPGDPRTPEALALSVRSTRWGCGDKETTQYSKAAFDLLHRRYPQTIWAKNTPYWF